MQRGQRRVQILEMQRNQLLNYINYTLMDFATWRGKAGSALTRFQGSMHKTVKGWYRLKDFIRLIRKASTKAEERALMAKESARIRSALRSPDCQSDERWHGLAKLLFMHLHASGYGGGQQQVVEFMKVVAAASAGGSASPMTNGIGGITTGITRGRSRLSMKRLGYFGATLLLDSTSSASGTLLLLTNTLKQDLETGGEAVQRSALGCLAALPNTELCFELAPSVISLVKDPSIGPRAAVCLSVMMERHLDIAEMASSQWLCGLVEEWTRRSNDASSQLAAAHLISSYPHWSLTDRHGLANLVVRQLASSSPSPVVTVARLQALRHLQCAEPEIVGQLKQYTKASIDKLDNHQKFSQLASLLDAFKTIAVLSPQDGQLVADGIGRVLEVSGDGNVRLVAMECLWSLEPKTDSVIAAITRNRVAILKTLQEGDSLLVKLATQLAMLIVVDEKTFRVVLEHVLGSVQWLSNLERRQIGQRLVELAFQYDKSEGFLVRLLSVLNKCFPVDHDDDDEFDGDEGIVKYCIDRLALRSIMEAVPKMQDYSKAALKLVIWLHGRRATTVDQLESIFISDPRVFDDELLTGHVLMACQQMACHGVDTSGFLWLMAKKAKRRVVLEQIMFTRDLLVQCPSDILRMAVEPDLLSMELSDCVRSMDHYSNKQSDARGRLVFTGTGLSVYMRRETTSDGDQHDQTGTIITATVINPLQHAAQPTRSVSLQVAVPKPLSVSISSSSTGEADLPPFSASPLQYTISVSGLVDETVRLRARVRYWPAASDHQLVDIIDVCL